MSTLTEIYDICRDYVDDSRDTLGGLYSILHGYIRSRDLVRLAESTSLFDPALHGIDIARTLRQISALFKKNAVFVDNDRCLKAAEASFNKAETVCRITNRRLTHYYVHQDRLDPELYLLMGKMERSISDLLGSFDDFLENIPASIKVTSGASATQSRKQSLPYLKLSRRVYCSPGAIPYLAALQTYYGYSAVKFKGLPLNRVEFVPKNFKTHRTIACEPAGNVPLQLAFDRYAKDRLQKWKVDLSSQVLNQRLAKEGSINGKFATVDLSMASDTLALAAVEWLLPPAWTKYLKDVRSSHYINSFGRFTPYSKFSSMGNGSTFALETLIFAAAVRAVGSHQYAVYGDDIVIETELYGKLTKLLSFLGFSVNLEKSYAEGPFRESCGTDWFNGGNITPFYLREWDQRKNILAHNVNGLVRVSKPEGLLWSRMRDIVKARNVLCVPPGEDTMSGVFIDVHSCYAKKLLTRKSSDNKLRGYQSVLHRAYLTKNSSRKKGDSRTLFLWYLDRLYQGGDEEGRLWYPIMGHQGLLPNLTSTTVSSRVPNLVHKFRTGWVVWKVPRMDASDHHLYIWSDFLFPNIGE